MAHTPDRVPLRVWRHDFTDTPIPAGVAPAGFAPDAPVVFPTYGREILKVHISTPGAFTLQFRQGTKSAIPAGISNTATLPGAGEVNAAWLITGELGGVTFHNDAVGAIAPEIELTLD